MKSLFSRQLSWCFKRLILQISRRWYYENSCGSSVLLVIVIVQRGCNSKSREREERKIQFHLTISTVMMGWRSNRKSSDIKGKHKFLFFLFFGWWKRWEKNYKWDKKKIEDKKNPTSFDGFLLDNFFYRKRRSFHLWRYIILNHGYLFEYHN